MIAFELVVKDSMSMWPAALPAATVQEPRTMRGAETGKPSACIGPLVHRFKERRDASAIL